MSVFTGTAEAAVVWSEDFESGLTDWTILGYNGTTSLPIAGNYSDADGMLTSLDDDHNLARHDSTTSVGTWSFDMFVPDDDDGNGAVDVMFMSNGTRPFPIYSSMTVSFEAWYNMDRFDLWELRGNGEGILLDQYTPSAGIEGWWHVEVSRSSGGHFWVYLNENLIMDVVNNDVTSSTYFEFYCGNSTGAALDNIVVSDEVLPPPETSPTPTPTATPIPLELIAIGVGVVAVVVILAVVCMRRK